jgi:ATP-dependent exoDNAse (exonuclease V) alpha subunit
MVKPIRPNELEIERAFPEFVLEAFNNTITQHYRNGVSSFKDKDIIAEIIKMSEATGNPVTRSEIYTQRWLDVEELYIKYDWQVSHESPGWGERQEGSFTFKPKKK